MHGGHCLFAQSLVCSDSEPTDSFVLALRVGTETRRPSTRDCTQRSTTPAASTAPDTQRQVVRDTPIYSSRHARPASRPVRVPSSESDSVARAGHTAAGPATLRPGWLSSVPGTWWKRWRGSRPCAALLNQLTPDLIFPQQVSILTRPDPPYSGPRTHRALSAGMLRIFCRRALKSAKCTWPSDFARN